MIRRRMTIRGPSCTPKCAHRTVAVLDQIGRALRSIGKADADQRLGAGQLTKLAKLIDPDVVRIDPSPIFIWPRCAQITVADAILPMVLAGIDARSAPADDGRMNGLDHLDN